MIEVAQEPQALAQTLPRPAAMRLAMAALTPKRHDSDLARLIAIEEATLSVRRQWPAFFRSIE